jgi:hypothetical protein
MRNLIPNLQQVFSKVAKIPSVWKAICNLVDAFYFTPKSIETLCTEYAFMSNFLLLYPPNPGNQALPTSYSDDEKQYLFDYWSCYFQVIYHAISITPAEKADQSTSSDVLEPTFKFKYTADECRKCTEALGIPSITEELRTTLLCKIMQLRAADDIAATFYASQNNNFSKLFDLMLSQDDARNVKRSLALLGMEEGTPLNNPEQKPDLLFFTLQLFLQPRDTHTTVVSAINLPSYPGYSQERTTFLDRWLTNHFTATVAGPRHPYYTFLMTFSPLFNAHQENDPAATLLNVFKAYVDIAYQNERYEVIKSQLENADGDADEKTLMLLFLAFDRRTSDAIEPTESILKHKAIDLFIRYTKIKPTDKHATISMLEGLVLKLSPKKYQQKLTCEIISLVNRKGIWGRSNYGKKLKNTIDRLWDRLERDLKDQDPSTQTKAIEDAEKLASYLKEYQSRLWGGKNTLEASLHSLENQAQSLPPEPRNMLHYVRDILLQPQEILSDKLLQMVGIQRSLLIACLFFMLAVVIMVTTQLYLAHMLTLTSLITMAIAGVVALGTSLLVGLGLWAVLPNIIPGIPPLSSLQANNYTRTSSTLHRPLSRPGSHPSKAGGAATTPHSGI